MMETDDLCTSVSPVMSDSVNRLDPAFQANRAASLRRMALLQERMERVKEGDERSVERHRARGKLTARQRVARLIDHGTAFLEVGALAAWDVYDNEVPGAGIIAGVGLVCGRPCLILANDATVKGGTYYPLTVKKHLRAQEIAAQNRLPCIYLVDSGGANLPHQAEVFPDREHFGRIFYNQARMSADGIPQLSAVMGSSTAGGAYIPAMSDETTIVDGVGTVFLGGPPLVKAATGEVVDAEVLGGGWVHATVSGVVDHLASNDDDAIEYLRSAVARIPRSHNLSSCTTDPPLFDPEDIYGLIPEDPMGAMGIRGIIARTVDGSRFHEFKASFGETLICGFGKIAGMEAAMIANNGILFSESAQKAAHFIELASARKVPLIFLQNINGFMVGRDYEHGGIAKHGAKMVMAVACTNVPKITVVIGGSYGAGNYAMAGRAYSPRFLWQWPNARIAVMGGEQAATVMTTVGRHDRSREEREQQARVVREKFDRESDAYYSTARLWDDGIIDPARTREILMMSLLATSGSTIEATRFGVFRM